MPKLKAKKKNDQDQINPDQINQNQDQNIQDNQNLKQNLTNSDNEINLDPEIDKLQELKNPEDVLSEAEQPKKKRGRKPKSETISEPELPEIDLSPLLEIGIKRLPNPLPLSELEKQLFNQTANKVFQKYSGGFKYIEELNLGLVLVSLIYPRLKQENAEK